MTRRDRFVQNEPSDSGAAIPEPLSFSPAAGPASAQAEADAAGVEEPSDTQPPPAKRGVATPPEPQTTEQSPNIPPPGLRIYDENGDALYEPGWDLLQALPWRPDVHDLAKPPNIDYLTATVGSDVGLTLQDAFPLEEPGKPRFGFGQTARHRDCWRRWDPVEPSKTYGLAYESWEWDGPQAGEAAMLLQSFQVRLSRVDVAFDFRCPDDLVPDDVVEAWRHPTKRGKARTGLTIGSSGPEPFNTRYIGSRASPRYVRIYRKDVQAPELFPEPVLRVEVVLTGDLARAWWRVYLGSAGWHAAAMAAAAHVREMTGVALVAGNLVIPEIEPEPEAEVAFELFEWYRQHGPALAAQMEAGLDVRALAQASVENPTRWGRSRYNRRVDRIISAGLELVQASVFRLLRLDRRDQSGKTLVSPIRFTEDEP